MIRLWFTNATHLQLLYRSFALAVSVSVGSTITVIAAPISAQVEKAHERKADSECVANANIIKAGSEAEPLSRTQLQRLAANARIYNEKVSPLQAELKVDKQRLMEVLLDETVSEPHAHLLQAKIALLKSDIRDLKLKKQMADSSVMTATQRQALQHHHDKVLASSTKTAP